VYNGVEEKVKFVLEVRSRFADVAALSRTLPLAEMKRVDGTLYVRYQTLGFVQANYSKDRAVIEGSTSRNLARRSPRVNTKCTG